MNKRFLTDVDGERIDKALSKLEKKVNEFKPEFDESEIIGGYYVPKVDEDGDLSWTPNKDGLPSVPAVNIRGPRGYAGIAGVSATHRWNGTELTISSASGSSTRDLKGPAGKSAYQYAVEGGFTGSEEEFAAKLAALLQ